MNKYINKLIISGSTSPSVNGVYTRSDGNLTPFLSSTGTVVFFDGKVKGWVVEDNFHRRLYLIDNSFSKVKFYRKELEKCYLEGDDDSDYSTSIKLEVVWNS